MIYRNLTKPLSCMKRREETILLNQVAGKVPGA
jgi:hypothetical protein